ncbi:hypothetical protein ACQKLN_25890, partial [Paenibacillus glucanolyticus]|uniref:hypothetical protein n=1 Tax=Paenibacillus glucanolyticus TaxID=59843 RepID=UPI0036833739
FLAIKIPPPSSLDSHDNMRLFSSVYFEGIIPPPGLYLSFSHKKNASTYHDQEDIPRLKETFFMELSHLFSFAENL